MILLPTDGPARVGPRIPDPETLREVVEVLREVEFSGERCPSCRGWSFGGHAPDCRLVALLKKLDPNL